MHPRSPLTSVTWERFRLNQTASLCRTCHMGLFGCRATARLPISIVISTQEVFLNFSLAVLPIACILHKTERDRDTVIQHESRPDCHD
jgi:hypothetical protein